MPTSVATSSGELTYTVLLAGGPESNEIRIWLTPDGRTYVIDSIYPLEVGGTVCEHPPANPNELVCQAPQVAAFEFNADGGDDQARVTPEVRIPVTMRGGPGRDTLVGGSGPDKLSGGNGVDKLIGRDGDDVLLGGNGNDALFGGRGDDVLRGGHGGRQPQRGRSRRARSPSLAATEPRPPTKKRATRKPTSESAASSRKAAWMPSTNGGIAGRRRRSSSVQGRSSRPRSETCRRCRRPGWSAIRRPR